MALKIRDEIYHLIRNDVKLRMKMAEHLGVAESTIYLHAKRKAKKLSDYNLVRILMDHTGKSEEEIFTSETLNI
jgi:hypothetical protein